MVDKKTNVLIVDDEQVVCDLLHEELSERGYLCTTVLDGNDANALAVVLMADDVADNHVLAPGILVGFPDVNTIAAGVFDA